MLQAGSEMDNVAISVVVTNHNYGNMIRRCIRSLLHQDINRSLYEIIVIDDASTDDSLEALESFRVNEDIRLITNTENLGIGAASRLGVLNSYGKYFVRVDSDDYVQPAFLYMLYNYLKFKPEYAAVTCDYFVTSNDEQIISVESFDKNAIACGVMFRTSYLEVIGSYNPDKEIFEDVDLFDRLDKGKIYHLPVPLYNYVKHEKSATTKYAKKNRRK